MALANLEALPTADHLTLLFKHGRSTTLLSLLPSQNFHEAKSLLLAALQSRDLTEYPDTHIPLPSSPNDIDLAILVDRRDISKGWTQVEKATVVPAKGAKKSTAQKSSELATTFGDLALKDGDILAYRPHESSEDEDEDLLNETGKASTWNVILPSYDEEDEADGDDANKIREGHVWTLQICCKRSIQNTNIQGWQHFSGKAGRPVRNTHISLASRIKLPLSSASMVPLHQCV